VNDGTQAFDLPTTCPGIWANQTSGLSVCEGAGYQFVLGSSATITGGNLTLSATGVPAGTTVTFGTNPLTPGGTSTVTSISFTSLPGAYTVRITATNSSGSYSTKIDYTVLNRPDATTLIAPADLATGVNLLPTLSWTPVADAPFTRIYISTVANFATTVISQSVTGTSFTPTTPLLSNTTYYWRVATYTSTCTAFSTINSFTTFNCSPITVTNPAISTVTVGTSFSQNFTQTGGNGAITFITTSTLPAGLTLSASGVLSGTPTVIGTFPIVVKLTDENGCSGTGATYSLFVSGIIINASSPFVITAENAVPVNNAPDPGETLTVNLPLVNVGNINTTNLVATLLATGGVTNPSGPQTYGVVVSAGSSVAMPYTFTATGNCGDHIILTLALQDGANNLGTISYTLSLGTVSGSGSPVTFSNTSAIVIPASGAASPYPSNITVSGFTGIANKVTVSLKNFNHTYPDDVDVLLVSPTGQKMIIMSDVGGDNAITNNVTITLDDAAAGLLPNATVITTGTYRPTNIGAGDVFPASAPDGPYLTPASAGTATLNSAFAGEDPNGVWSLYVVDQFSPDAGNFNGGWEISFAPALFVCSVVPTSATINAGTVTGTIKACAGSSSVNPDIQQFAVTGGALTADIVVNAPVNFEASTSAGSGYSSSVTLTQSGGNVAAVIYVRSLASAPVGPISGNVTLTSAGATPVSVAVSGIVNPIPDAIATPASQTSVSGAAITTIVLSNSISGTVFNWTRDNAVVTGIAASGSGDISGSLTNLTSSPITVTFTITPTANGCNGVPITAIVIVNPIPVINASTPVVITAENAVPLNNAPDPGETLTVNLPLVNVGGTNTTNLVATLLATGGVTNPSGPQTYGVVIAGGSSVARPYTFTAVGNCGDNIILTLALQDGTTNLGTITYTLALGTTGGGSGSPVTFANTTAITIPGTGTGTGTGAPANPYPSNINVSGLTGTITKITVAVKLFNHTFPDDVDVLLVSPTGQKMIIMSGAGGATDVVNVNLVLDDAAAALLPSPGAIASGTYKPTNTSTIGDLFPVPAPAGPYLSPAPLGATTFATAFNGLNPNGTWSLYVVDHAGDDAGNFNGGWEISITTSAPNVCSVVPRLLSIDDVIHNEGNSGPTTYSFTVSLSSPAPAGGVTFDIATANNTATTANNDYVTKSLTGQTIPEGSSNYTFDATVNGDNAIEADETFFVNITNVIGATLSDGQGEGTITNDDFQATTSLTLVSNNNSSCTNTAVSFTATLAQITAPVGPIAGQSVTFTLTNPGALTTTLTGTTNAAGQATVTFGPSSFTTAGVYSVQASFAGSALYLASSSPVITHVVSTAPAFSICPSNQSVNAQSNSCSNIVTYIATATGTPDPTITYAFSNATSGTGNGTGSGSSFNVGLTTVTLTATNGCGNAATCSFTVTVLGTTVITCPADITVNNDNNQCSAVVNYAPPVAPVNCNGGTPTTQTFNYTGAMQTWTVPPGVTSIHVDAYGAQGGKNVYSVNFEQGKGGKVTGDISVIPGSVLNIFVGGTSSNAVGGFNGGGNGTLNEGGGGGATDIRVGGLALANRILVAGGGGGGGFFGASVLFGSGGGLTGEGGSTFGAGVLATGGTQSSGGNGGLNNSGTCAPGNLAQNGALGIGGNGTTGSGTCSTAGGTGGGGGYYGGGGMQVNTAGGGSSYTDPVLVTNVIHTQGIQTGNGKIVVTYSGASYTVVQSAGLLSGSAFPVGTTTNTFEVHDGNTVVSTCSFDVTVTDNQNPTITCPANITKNNDPNQCGAVVTYAATASDNCPGVSVSYSPASGSFFPVGTTTVTATATDASGNTASCTFTVTVTDAQNPTITCPANITKNNDPNQCGAVVTYAATASDNCPGVSVNYSPASGSFFPVGTTTVTATATDAVGHTASCTFTVKVVDAQNPSITCPANITVNNDANQCGAVVTYAATASDNCPGVSISYSPASGSFFPAGTTTVTATATDAAGGSTAREAFTGGNTATCTFTVTVVDAQNPSITCPANIKVNNDANQCGAVVTYAATASDNCPGVSISYSPASGSFFPVGTTTVTATATDAAGRTATCTFTVTVVDAQNPTIITCPGNQTFNNDNNQCGAQVGFFATASDNCPGVSVSYSPASFSFFPLGTTTVTATATDAAGNTASCTFTVTVVDAQNPTITCPANITKNNDANQCGAVVTYSATATDNCAGVSAVTFSPASGSFFPVGTTTVTASATDAVGHTSSCTFTITVTDAQNPTVTCPANITVNSPIGQCGAPVSFTATANDNCPGVSISYSPASGSTFLSGTTTVTATATDASGRTAACTFTVTVVDTQNPTITCPANITTGNTPGQCGAFVNFSATANDNCPGVTISYSKAPGSFFTLGTTTITATATDAAGRTATCTFTVKVQDTQAPTLICPSNVTQTITSGCSKKLTPPDPTVIDNCGLSKLTWRMTGANSGNSSSSGINYVGNKTFNAGVTTITYTATDIYGNSSECSFTVSILETVPPSITCPPNKTVGTNYGYCYWSHVNLGTPRVSDNCGVLSVTNNAPDTFQLGTTIVTWTVTDNSGNTSSCNQSITVTDQQTPSVTCPANIYQNASVNCVTTVTTPDPIYYDNCTVAKLTWVMTGATTASSPNTGINVVGTKNFNVGTTTITYTVKDAFNNSWSCSFAVTITDNTKPTVTCPANIALPATAGACNRSITMTDPTYSDNCGVVKLTWYTEGATNISSPTNGINKIGTKTFNVGVTTVTYTAYDPWGNSKQCTFTVTITDNQPPVATCPPAQTQCKKSSNTYTIPTLTSNDNCSIASITYQITGVTTRSGSGSNASGTFNLGLSTITWTVKDASGNTTTCSTNVTIVPAGSCRLVSNEPTDDPKIPETKTPSKGKLDLIVQDSKLGVTAYPNPTEYYFNVKVKSESKETVEIKMYDGLGKVVQVKRGTPDQTYRFGDNVAGGIYIIEVRQGGQVATVKVMKE
jgi:subtilisin-like proprotein convertase family protein